jgi:dephospho-CoA kinase
VNRTTMNEVGTDLRRTNAPDYYVTLFVARAKAAGVTDFVIESIRNVKEAEAIKAAGGFLIVADADEHLRYERVMARKSATDQVSFEEFRAQEAREMDSENPDDPAFMNMRAVIAMADATVMNNGTLEELGQEVDRALATLSK